MSKTQRVIQLISIDQKMIDKDSMMIVAIYTDSAEVYDELIRANIRPQYKTVMRELNQMSNEIKEIEKILDDPAITGVVITKDYASILLKEIKEEKEIMDQDWEDYEFDRLNYASDDFEYDPEYYIRYSETDNGDYDFLGWFGSISSDI